MKFLALNVGFSNLSPDPLRLTKPAHVGVKEGYSTWKVIIFPLLSCPAWKRLHLS